MTLNDPEWSLSAFHFLFTSKEPKLHIIYAMFVAKTNFSITGPKNVIDRIFMVLFEILIHFVDP